MSGKKLRIGVSACLLGDLVRYDGGHKKDEFLTRLLDPYVQWVRFCPEAESGLGTPREPMRLVKTPGGIRLLGIESEIDFTDRLREYGERQMPRIGQLDLTGFILKKNSPSCGRERVKVFNAKGVPAGASSGLFAAALTAAYPRLPVEEEGRLQDPALRDNFVERLFAYRRVRDLFSGRWNLDALVKFHTAHKLQLLAHSPKEYESLGRFVATARGRPRAELADRYEARFMAALARPATPASHANVLQHMAGFFKKDLTAGEKAELKEAIDDYRRGILPLLVPLTLVKHHVKRLGVEYLAGQHYLEPHPKELRLRNGL